MARSESVGTRRRTTLTVERICITGAGRMFWKGKPHRQSARHRPGERYRLFPDSSRA
jgi:hypothetical protein